MAEKEKNDARSVTNDTTKAETEPEAEAEEAPQVTYVLDPAYQSHYRYSNPGEFPGRNLGPCGCCGCCPCNPLKCCCGGNLRKACFGIGIFEVIFCLWTVPCIIYYVVIVTTVDFGLSAQYGGNNNSSDIHGPNRSTSSTLVVLIIFLLILLATPISMLLGAIKRFNVACILHTIFSSCVAGFHVFLSFIFILALILVAAYRRICADNTENGKDKTFCKARDVDVLTAIFSLLLIYSVSMSILFIHFGIDSASLYCQYRSGINYEGDLCGSGKIQPQSQNQWQAASLGQDPQDAEQTEDAPPLYTDVQTQNQKERQSTEN